jgi:hypothetical protein
LGLSAAVETTGQQIDCLRQVLRIEPGNDVAAKGLAILMNQAKPAPAASSAAAAPPAAVTPAPQSQEEPEEVETPEEASAEQATQPDEAYEDRLSNIAVPPVETPTVFQPLRASDYLAIKQEKVAIGEAPAEEIQESAPVVFKARPSQVSALLAFWIFFFGAVIVGVQLAPLSYLGLAIAAGLWLILEIVVLYVIVFNFRTQYELTGQSLNLRSQLLARRQKVPLGKGEWLKIPLPDIVHLETRQSWFQELIGTGDILLDAAVNGVLTRLRIRSIPELDKRVNQIKSLMEVQDHVAV